MDAKVCGVISSWHSLVRAFNFYIIYFINNSQRNERKTQIYFRFSLSYWARHVCLTTSDRATTKGPAVTKPLVNQITAVRWPATLVSKCRPLLLLRCRMVRRHFVCTEKLTKPFFLLFSRSFFFFFFCKLMENNKFKNCWYILFRVITYSLSISLVFFFLFSLIHIFWCRRPERKNILDSMFCFFLFFRYRNLFLVYFILFYFIYSLFFYIYFDFFICLKQWINIES